MGGWKLPWQGQWQGQGQWQWQWQGQNRAWSAARQAPYPGNQGGNVAVDWQEEEEEDLAEQPDPFDPEYYADANQTFVSNEVKRAAGWNAQNSFVLRLALEEAGVPDPTELGVDNQAHHIVETSNELGQEILAWAGIEPNSAVNGVLLPSKDIDGIRDNLTFHLGSHTEDYTNSINDALNAAADSVGGYVPLEYRQEAVVDRLNMIREVLLTQRVPLNAGGDPDYSEEGPVTVEEIFGEAGLFD